MASPKSGRKKAEGEEEEQTMKLPTIHMNGTGVQDLLDANEAAWRALRLAMDAMRQAAPNGRDYYPQEAGAIEVAIDEHQARLHAMHGIARELQEMGEYLATEQEKRTRRPSALAREKWVEQARAAVREARGE